MRILVAALRSTWFSSLVHLRKPWVQFCPFYFQGVVVCHTGRAIGWPVVAERNVR